MNIRIAIADKNTEYLKRISGVMQQYEELEVSVFTCRETLEEALKKTEFQTVLFNQDISEEPIYFPKNTMLVCLYCDDFKNEMLYPSAIFVRKYQRISRIYKEIMRNLADYAGSSQIDFKRESSTHVVAVYSPIGGSGKTVVSMALAKRMRSLGKTVFFLNLEQLNSTVGQYPSKEEGITELVGSMHSDVNFELKLKGLMKENMDGVFYVEGFDRLVDYEDVSGEEITDVITAIRESAVCDYIVVDMGSTLDSLGKAVLELANQILLIECAGELEEIKIKHFLGQILLEKNKSKISVIRNFADPRYRQAGLADLPTIGCIRNYGQPGVRELVSYMAQDSGLQIERILQSL